MQMKTQLTPSSNYTNSWYFLKDWQGINFTSKHNHLFSWFALREEWVSVSEGVSVREWGSVTECEEV